MSKNMDKICGGGVLDDISVNRGVTDVEAENRGHVTRYDVSNMLEKLKRIHGQRFIDYRNAWDQTCKCEEASEYPLFIELAINSDCNMRCKMCARSFDETLNSKHINMPLEMVDTIVAQCKDFHLPAILIGQESECLLHPELKEIVRRIRMIDPVDFFLITNGTLLNKELSKFLIDFGLDRLEVSIDAATSETYKKIRGGSLEMLERNIADFLDARTEMGSERPFLRVSFCRQQDNLMDEEIFLNKWAKVADMVDFQDYIDFSNTTYLKDREYKEYHCPDPFQRLVIDYNGDIFGCCSFGYNHYFKVGNLKDISILDAWNSRMMKELRESFIRQDLKKPCLNCRANR